MGLERVAASHVGASDESRGPDISRAYGTTSLNCAPTSRLPAVEASAARHRRYARAIEGERLPCAIVDLDAVDSNVDVLVAPVRRQKKTLRVASKSLRCPALIHHVMKRGGDAMRGVMTYDAQETAFLVDQGFDDLLLAYPTVQPDDVATIAQLCARGALVSVVVDSVAHLGPLNAAAKVAGTTIAVVIDVDVSYRPLGHRVHLGVRRSPVRTPQDVLQLHNEVMQHEHLRFHGLMAYEAQIAGVVDDTLPKRAMKRLSRIDVAETRARIVEALRARSVRPTLFNGGGTGSVLSSTREEALTEVTAGSGFVCSHLFEGYRGLPLTPAAFFALQVTRVPSPGLVTCAGGGFVASGQPGPDRLPRPALPEGLALLPLEGAGEVQTPLVVPEGVALRVGDPVFFRHAKGGELAEHFAEYLFVRGDRVEARAPTYRGLGRCFLG
jgi:D-serine deaminase-like pyridoxal phosphate-dependent protein